MTRVLILSDLHFEFQSDRGEAFCKLLTAEHDIAVVAGDLCDYRRLKRCLPLISRYLKEVVYIIGNHECYKGSIPRALDRARRVCESLPNVHFLEDSAITLHGIRFIGCTMWFKYPPKSGGSDGIWALNDFDKIRGIRKDIQAKNFKSVRFLEENVTSDDVVITHHLPSLAAVHPKYMMDEFSRDFNKFYVCDVERVIRKQKPRLWIHGHTHESMDHHIGSTRVICNPFGYLETSKGPDVNPRFSESFVVEL